MSTELNDKWDYLNKRLDDQKTFLALLVSIGGIVFAVLAIVFTWNVASEKIEIREFKKEAVREIREELGKTTQPPKITLLTNTF